MLKTKFGELPTEAAVGAYMKIHRVEQGEIVVSVQRALFMIQLWLCFLRFLIFRIYISKYLEMK